MNSYILIGAIIGILTYIPLCIKINRGLKQNFLTWVLWGLLDGITFFSILLQDGNFWLPGAYALGSCLISILLLIKLQEKSWTWFEKSVSGLVIVCLMIWYFAGTQMATIAGTAAVTIAGIPMLKDAYERPEEVPLGTYFMFFLANLLSTIGAKDWSIEERLYPASCTLYCFLLVILTLRKFNEDIELERR